MVRSMVRSISTPSKYITGMYIKFINGIWQISIKVMIGTLTSKVAAFNIL